MKQYFKTTKVHHCFNQEMNIENGPVVPERDLQPKKCKCRKFISREFAADLVADGAADWVIKYPEGTPTFDIVLKGIVGKTPRAQTIEKAHIERYIDQIWNLGITAFEEPEVLAHLEMYHDIEMTERLKLFRNIGFELVAMKTASDDQGDLKGEAGHVLHNKIISEADTLKIANAIDDPFIGEAIFMPIGAGDQRTVVGKDVLIGEEKLDKS